MKTRKPFMQEIIDSIEATIIKTQKIFTVSELHCYFNLLKYRNEQVENAEFFHHINENYFINALRAQLLQKLKSEKPGQKLIFDAIYNNLIMLAENWPLNRRCPLTGENLLDFDSMTVLSTGHRYESWAIKLWHIKDPNLTNLPPLLNEQLSNRDQIQLTNSDLTPSIWFHIMRGATLGLISAVLLCLVGGLFATPAGAVIALGFITVWTMISLGFDLTAGSIRSSERFQKAAKCVERERTKRHSAAKDPASAPSHNGNTFATIANGLSIRVSAFDQKADAPPQVATTAETTVVEMTSQYAPLPLEATKATP